MTVAHTLPVRAGSVLALASGLEWLGEAGHMLGLSRGRCGGRHRESRVERAWLPGARTGGGITTYVCIHEYNVFTDVFSGGRDTCINTCIRSACACIQQLGLYSIKSSRVNEDYEPEDAEKQEHGLGAGRRVCSA